MANASPPVDGWKSRLGVILAVAGSAVGLGNFLRFPGQAAQNGAGAFMIPYFISLLILGIPLAWAEWTMGRYGGIRGFNSAPGIFAVIWGHRRARFLGTLGLLIPLVIYMYYVFIEAWCLGYAWNYLAGNLMLGSDPKKYSTFFSNYIGTGEDGLLIGSTSTQLLSILCGVFLLNFVLIYRGIGKGIETFCKFAMPVMAGCAVCVLVRVLTLGTPDPYEPGRNVLAGLGSMWNPNFDNLLSPSTWIAAAGQIFFSLSVGFGVIINYASYLSRKDDVALSGLTACTTNEFFEVCLGGMITLPAAFLFFGASAATMGTFGLGFNALPNVFAQMPAGRFFGFLWFFMLFLAAVTSSVSMLQPVIAFLEEGFGLKRTASAPLLAIATAAGTGFVVFHSKDTKAMDTLDFWVGTVGIFLFGLVQTLVYGWVFGIRRGEVAMHEGSHIRVPRLVQYVLKYVAPTYLLIIFVTFCYQSVPTQYKNVVTLGAAAADGLTTGPVPASVRQAWIKEAANQGVTLDLTDDLTFRRDDQGMRLDETHAVPRFRLSPTPEGLLVTRRVPGYYENTINDPVAAKSFLLICIVTAVLLVMVLIAGRRWDRQGRYDAAFTTLDSEEPPR